MLATPSLANPSGNFRAPDLPKIEQGILVFSAWNRRLKPGTFGLNNSWKRTWAMNSGRSLFFVGCGTILLTGCSTIAISHVAAAAPAESAQQVVEPAEPAVMPAASAAVSTDLTDADR